MRKIGNILGMRAASNPPVLLDSSAESQVTVAERLDESGKLCKILLRFKKVHITTDPARGMVYNTDKKTENDTMLFVIILVIKKIIL